MSRDDEEKVVESLKPDTIAVLKFVRLLELRRSRFRGRLEEGDDPEARGAAKECRALIKLLNE